MYMLSNRNDIIKKKISSQSGINIELLENGSIFSINHKDIMINQILGSPVESQISNIYLRIYDSNGIKVYPLIGPNSHGELSFNEYGFSCKGIIENIEYNCQLELSDTTKSWQYVITINNLAGKDVTLDMIYTQDIGLATEGVVRTNELYTSHYIDQSSFEHDQIGPVIMFRQNQKQNHMNPWLMIACLSGADSFSTDGYQFYGLDYKLNGCPAAFQNRHLTNEVYQYEFCMAAIQSNQIEVKNTAEIRFLSYFVENHRKETSMDDLKYVDEFMVEEDGKVLRTSFDDYVSFNEMVSKNHIGELFRNTEVFQADNLLDEDIEVLFSDDLRHKEILNGELLSFYYGDHQHVVLREKERYSERTHGHIMRSGKSFMPDDNQLAVTSWMNGIFSSHVTVGNTNFNKMISVSRNGLNVLKSSGQRIFIKDEEGWKLLSTPSAFEMGINYARWIYKSDEILLEVKVWTSPKNPSSNIMINVLNDKLMEFKILSNILVGDLEFETNGFVQVNEEKGTVLLKPHKDELISREYPESAFGIATRNHDKVNKLRVIESSNGGKILPYVSYETKACSAFSLILTGSILDGKQVEETLNIIEDVYESYESAVSEIKRHYFSISQRPILKHGQDQSIEKLNDLIPWYIHNAFIHLASPHGLEQYSGAAWGLRDVCQGPVELLLSINQYGVLRDLLKLIYAKQIKKTGDWRQWFMVDRFSDIQDSNSHNDIVVWPLKAICDYIEATNDTTILEESVDYIDSESLQAIGERESIKNHIARQIQKISEDTIKGTSLIRYGHGDWEDTLQPSNEALRDNLVSPWTVALVYENLTRYVEISVKTNDDELVDKLKGLCDCIKSDFNKYLIKDDVVSGLVYFDHEKIDYIIHPSSEIVDPKYRLIPMNRGIISGIFTADQAKVHLNIIEKHLTFIDGVHLMNKPLEYKGGLETYFKRAETGANYGREIGLQYIHAHIRYLQALAYMGEGEKLYDGLQRINPINIKDMISTATVRQSNCYYSSSDADFKNRYSAYERIEDINNEKVGIKGGWRIYSSGPGIYLSQLMMNFLGDKNYFDKVLIDPVLPKELDGLTMAKNYGNSRLTYRYHVKDKGYSPQKVVINGVEVKDFSYQKNQYRQGGMLISKERFESLLNKDKNIIEVYL